MASLRFAVVPAVPFVVACALSCACASVPGASTLIGGTRSSDVETNAREAAASTDPADAPQIQPDRPDVTNAAYTVPKGLVQLELGAQHSRVPVSGDSTATPLSVRVGIAHWFEARLESDGLTRSKEGPQTSTQFPGVTIGGKFRMWAPQDGAPVLAILPAVTLPWGRNGGGTDYILTIISGGDLPRHFHVDVNYGFGALARDDGGHFVQQKASASANVSIGSHWSPYLELYWFSKLQPDARPAVALDTGATYTIGERFALDGGVAFGLTSAVNGPTVFGGLSVIVGGFGRHASVHARLLDAQARGDR